MKLVGRKSPAGFGVTRALVSFNALREVITERTAESCAILVILNQRHLDIEKRRVSKIRYFMFYVFMFPFPFSLSSVEGTFDVDVFDGVN